MSATIWCPQESPGKVAILMKINEPTRDNVEKILEVEERGAYREDFLYEHSLIEVQQGRFHSAERLRL